MLQGIIQLNNYRLFIFLFTSSRILLFASAFMKKQEGKHNILMHTFPNGWNTAEDKHDRHKKLPGKKSTYSDVSKATRQIIKQCAFISPELIPSISAQEP